MVSPDISFLRRGCVKDAICFVLPLINLSASASPSTIPLCSSASELVHLESPDLTEHAMKHAYTSNVRSLRDDSHRCSSGALEMMMDGWKHELLSSRSRVSPKCKDYDRQR